MQYRKLPPFFFHLFDGQSFEQLFLTFKVSFKSRKQQAFSKSTRATQERLSYVISRASEKAGCGVVVLVDEYDKPLLQTLCNIPLMEEYRQTLKAFYGVLKSSDRYLRFVFLTGVTKFAQVSVFSDLNQLNDISMKPQYATICGITMQELTHTFAPEIQQLAEHNGLTQEEALQKSVSRSGVCVIHCSLLLFIY